MNLQSTITSTRQPKIIHPKWKMYCRQTAIDEGFKKCKGKLKFTPEPAMKTQRWSRGIDPLFL